MGIVETFMLAVALAMDAFAVCIGTACALPKLTAGHYVRMAGAFGFFQFLMPVIGYWLGLSVRSYIEMWDHWVSFAMLAYIGISMVRESFDTSEEEAKHSDPSRGCQLFVLAVATSLDALAVGLSFAMLHVSPIAPSLMIGVVCAIISAFGLYIGSTLTRAKALGHRAELFGGLILIGIGIKILIEHNALGFCNFL